MHQIRIHPISSPESCFRRLLVDALYNDARRCCISKQLLPRLFFGALDMVRMHNMNSHLCVHVAIVHALSVGVPHRTPAF